MAAMKTHLLHPRELGPSLVEHWRQLLQAPGMPEAFSSPFFSPEFAQLVGEVRPRSRIAVIEADGIVVGFHGFEANALGLGGPLAARLSDGHGPVLDPRLHWDPAHWLPACGLRSWQFDHLPADLQGFAAHCTRRVSAWQVRLDAGFAAYRAGIETRSNWIRRAEPKLRRLERQIGPLRFEANTADPLAWDRLAQWKSAQYRRSGLVDHFATPWVLDYLERLRQSRGIGLTGMMSALYAGERVVAVHLGMRSQRVWHHYLPTYDRELAGFSPGMGLLLRMLQAAPDLGITMLDFSSGDMDYKRSVSTDCVQLAQGAVEPVWMRTVRRGARRAERLLRGSAPVLGAARFTRRSAVALLNAARDARVGVRR